MLEDSTTLIAACIMLIAACTDATQAVVTEYVEAKGVTWIQVYFLSEFVVGAVVICGWIIVFSCNYTYYTYTNENINVKFFQGGDYGFDENQHITYCHYVMSVFPDMVPLTKYYKKWIALVIRTLLG